MDYYAQVDDLKMQSALTKMWSILLFCQDEVGVQKWLFDITMLKGVTLMELNIH